MKMINVSATFHVCGIDTSGILQSYISYLSSYRRKNLSYVKKIKRQFVRVHRFTSLFHIFPIWVLSQNLHGAFDEGHCS